VTGAVGSSAHKEPTLATRRSLMKRNTIVWIVFVIFTGLLIVACAGTKLTHIKMDESYRGKPVSDILVIGITYNEEVRRSFENEFVTQLTAEGIEAISSTSVLPISADQQLEKDDVLKVVAEQENDAVIVTHLIAVEDKEVATPPARTSDDFYGDLYDFHSYRHDTRQYITKTLVRLETNLYDVKTEKRIWSGQSETMKANSTMQMIDQVVKVVIKDLHKNGLLPPK
jgi:hypothetical protein